MELGRLFRSSLQQLLQQFGSWCEQNGGADSFTQMYARLSSPAASGKIVLNSVSTAGPAADKII